LAEINDTADALDPGTSASEYSSHSAVLQRRLDNAKSDTESAIKEKEAVQKIMDELQAELELAKSNVGDTVQVAHNSVSTPARKVCLVPLENGFDLALKLDLCVIYLIQFCRRGRKQWQLHRWPQF
jgi:hypothetical protein